jgi:hypothetical protein
MMNNCKMEPGHPEWTEFRRRMDEALAANQCGAGPHDEAAEAAETATFNAIVNAPSMEAGIEIFDAIPRRDRFKVTRLVLIEMGLSESAIAATLENFTDLTGDCDCTAPRVVEDIYNVGRWVDAHLNRN